MDNLVSRPAIYTRVSTAQQEEGTSLETQAAASWNVAELDGQPVVPEFVFESKRRERTPTVGC